ncbi:serine/threonine protein kinase [Streptomyces sp. TRM66268-LWL]|uniref:non-specific serine/threonine protein kinase n=1 Tax=Streptomyces polyasparticus TaxID=2767826 RepID=A0ABR7SMN4_9ACTN|nr:serine/threonine-protein kinase [Streptomyces polyasparticus]MBC9715628.1 serine/threonine protein kinase [Streptomyces polyasparticus]
MKHGELIAGRYQLLRLLGRGGMGEVHEAEDLSLGRRVAVKALTSVGGMAPGNRAFDRFMREARALARVEHPCVVTLYDTGEHEGTPYLVMQVLDGRNLSQLVQFTGPLPVPAVCWVMRSMAEALATAHAAGVLHRDVKPSNVSVTKDGRVVLQDFGLARLMGEGALTTAGVAHGSPHFMPPEVIRGGLAEAAADLYGLGACAYFMLTGESPLGKVFDIGAVVERALGSGIPRLTAIPSALPKELAELVDRLCAQDAADRPQDAAEVAEVLVPMSAGGQASVARLLGGVLREQAVRQTFPAPADLHTGAQRVHHDTPGGSPDAEGPEYDWAELRQSGPALDDPARLWAPRAPVLSDVTRRLVLSSMSHQTALSRQREAVNLVQRGELEEAARMLAAVAPVCLARLGPDHPTTLTIQYWQAVCLARMGAGAEAVELLSRVNRFLDRHGGNGK